MPDTPEPRLAGRELDRACAAEIMGWPILDAPLWDRPERPPDWYANPANYPYLTDCGSVLLLARSPVQSVQHPWIPTENLGDAAALEAELARRGLQEPYLNALAEELTGSPLGHDWVAVQLDPGELFALVTAGPEARARAALKAVRGGK